MKPEYCIDLNLVVAHARKQREEKMNELLLRLVNRIRIPFRLGSSRERIVKHISAHSFD